MYPKLRKIRKPYVYILLVCQKFTKTHLVSQLYAFITHISLSIACNMQNYLCPTCKFPFVLNLLVVSLLYLASITTNWEMDKQKTMVHFMILCLVLLNISLYSSTPGIFLSMLGTQSLNWLLNASLWDSLSSLEVAAGSHFGHNLLDTLHNFESWSQDLLKEHTAIEAMCKCHP